MASILKRPKSRAKLPRYPHDLSRRNMFTSSVGQLLPVLYDWLDYGDRISIDERVFTRTQPLKTCAFVRCREYVDYFFVPIRQINGYFENAFFGIDDFMNSLYVNKSKSSVQGKSYYVPSTMVPYTFGFFRQALFYYPNETDLLYQVCSKNGDLYDYSYLVDVSGSLYVDEYGIPCTWNAMRLAHMLGYGTNVGNIRSNSPTANLVMNLHLAVAYQKIFFDYYRVSDWTPNNPFAFNLDASIKDQTIPTGSNSPALGNVDSIWKLRYRPLKKDYFNNIQKSPLFDLATDPNAYPYSVDGAAQISSVTSFLLSNYGVLLQGFSTMDINKRNDPQQSIVNNAYTSQASNMSSNQLRLMFAYERMLMITQRGGRHVDDQARAHYGVNMPQGISGEVYWLGSHGSDLMIGEVVSTAAGTDGSSSSVLGEIAGRGLGVSEKDKRSIKFKAPCQGYLMAIYSCVPDVDYKATGINKLNLYNSVMDYPHPELDNLGMQPLYAIQSSIGRVLSDSYSLSSIQYTTLPLIQGWQYRYSELKLSYDQVQGGFLETLSDWSSSIVFGQFGSISSSMYCPPTYLDGIFALTFAPPLIPASELPAGDGKPSMGSFIWLSTVQSSQSSTEAYTQIKGGGDKATYIWNNATMYSRDPLMHSIDFRYHKDTYLSTYGLPNI